jgi:hypothetical protein
MKSPFQSLFCLLAALLPLLFSCNDPSEIGANLLSGDELSLDYTDTLTLRAFSITTDSIRTYDPDPFTADYDNAHCGDFMDPIFGRTTASIYTQFSLNSSVAPDFKNALLDSLVLVLPYNATLSYGKLDESYGIEIYRLAQELPDTVLYYSNQTFETQSTPIGSKTYTPAVSDSVSILVPSADSMKTERQIPQLRIPLDATFANALLSDTAALENNAAFQASFKGIHIRPSSSNLGMVSFNIRNNLAGLWAYYREDTLHRVYQFPVFSGDVVTSHFEHDYEGSIAGDFLSQPSGSDSLLFLQGLSGLNIDLEVPFADNLGNMVINRAELVLPILRLEGDDSVFDPVPQIIVSEILPDSSAVVVRDLNLAISRVGDQFDSLFGGNATPSTTAYVVNLSAHFQDLIRGAAEKKLRISVYLKPEHAERVVLCGPGHPLTPAKIRLGFTRY